MMWLLAIVAVLVLAAVAMVASGRRGALEVDYGDRRDSRIPAGPITADSLRTVKFSLGLRGYRMSEVDTLLELLARQLEADAPAAKIGDHAAAGAPTASQAGEGQSPRPAAE